jgi:hypothetical protein
VLRAPDGLLPVPAFQEINRMTKHDSRPTTGHDKHAPGKNDRDPERILSGQKGSPLPDETEAELYDPASRLTLEGDAYASFGNDEHEGDPARGEASADQGGPRRSRQGSKDVSRDRGPKG